MTKITLSIFEERVKQALKWFHEPQRLGEESPLASPYFLSQTGHAPIENGTLLGLGKRLQGVIRAAAATLWDGPLPASQAAMQQAVYTERQTPGTPRFAYLVLELRCFQTYLKPHRLPDIWEHEDFLLGSKTEHYRDYDHAVQLLSAALLPQLSPPWRLEQPQQPKHLLGYEAAQQQICAALRAGQTVTISGAGGMGKSSLGAQIVTVLHDKATFWFTLRPTLNDHLGSLLFALGHFLQKQGALHLWQYVLAGGGKADDWHLALTLTREDLAMLAANPPLLCFDELERLQVWTPEDAHPAHLQIVEFIEGLRGVTPLLLIGQRPLFEAEHHQVLDGLTVSQIQQLWQQAALPINMNIATQVHCATGGNPQLLLLCQTLQQQGEGLADLLTGLPDRPGLQPIFRRLWSRLSSEQRQILQQLAVFRSFVPDYPWSPVILQELLERRLIERSGAGGVALLRALRDRIYRELAIELRQQLHLTAAHIRLEGAQYTAAAYHFGQAGKAVEAIRLWYPRMQQEIEHGQADAAIVTFVAIASQHLPQREQQALALIRATLRKLRGELVSGLAEAESVQWVKTGELYGRAAVLLGEFQDALGYPERAIASYYDSVATLARLARQIGHCHYQQGMVHLRQKEIAAVQQQARLLEYQLKYLQGSLSEENGQYTDAYLAYQQAFLLAQTVGEAAHMAQIESKIGDLFSRQQEIAKALPYYENAQRRYSQMGDRLNAERARSNLAAGYNQSQQFTAAITTALPAYQFFTAIQDRHWAAITASNLAEAHLEIGDLAAAQQYAQQVLDLEERLPYPYALFTLGCIKSAQQRWAEAQTYFEQTRQLAQSNRDLYLAAYVQRELGAVYRVHGQNEEATQSFVAALRFFEQAGMVQESEKTRQLINI